MNTANDVDGALWPPSASLGHLQRRAQILETIRDYFSRQQVLEVETPVLARAATADIQLENLRSCFHGPGYAAGLPLYLQTSPESAMKRLLAAGSGSIFQIARAFRDGEAGGLHNPEFTLLEWYRVGFDLAALMDDVAALVSMVLPDIDDYERLSYQQLFRYYLDIDPHRVTLTELRRLAQDHAIAVSTAAEAGDVTARRDAWLDLLMSHVIEPQLAGRGAIFVYDYPASQAALARLRPGSVPLAERFELYVRGVELANGYAELRDGDEQRRRFEQDRDRRRAAGRLDVPEDEYMLAALEHGLPDCSGVALGVDRLVMLAAGARSITEVMAFPIDRA